ncbi:MAG TPA: hypothetical protein VM638_09040 [Actinomycetota bacterium]|nr:hypothetical protein [Actinomycetota bacterium]
MTLRLGSGRRLRAAGVLLAVPLLLAGATSAQAYDPPGRTERVSVPSDGGQADFVSFRPSISADGVRVAFQSSASNLVPGDTNGWGDIFVRDRKMNTTRRVSVSSDGSQANRTSTAPAISADGRYVAFISGATNLVPGDTSTAEDVFVHDLATARTERVSVSSEGAEANAPAVASDGNVPAISADGRYVTFVSAASNLVPGDSNELADVFIRDRILGATERVSAGIAGVDSNGASGQPSISADGRLVAFQSTATNLVEGDTNLWEDAFVRDRSTGTTERISVGAAGAQGNHRSGWPSISADGRHVAFQSFASNLVPNDTNGLRERLEDRGWDIFVRDRTAGTTERVSVGNDGAEADQASRQLAISGDGRHVAFQSQATNLASGDTNAVLDVFIHDRQTRQTERLSRSSGGAQGNGHSQWPTLSADGRFVVFESGATNLVPGDSNGFGDIFVRDRGPGTGIGGVTVTVNAAQRLSLDGWARFAGIDLTSAADPAVDASAGAGSLGGELTGAGLTLRPENEDLLAGWMLSSLPATMTGSLPMVAYGLRFTLDGVAYEVRSLRTSTDAEPPGAPHFVLLRCASTCEERGRLRGGIGTVGSSVLVSIPLSAIGAEGGSRLTDIVAFTALAEARSERMATFDEVVLAQSQIQPAQVEAGAASDGHGEDAVAFSSVSGLSSGRFTATLDPPGGSGGSVWTRACLGAICAPAHGQAIP